MYCKQNVKYYILLWDNYYRIKRPTGRVGKIEIMLWEFCKRKTKRLEDECSFKRLQKLEIFKTPSVQTKQSQ